MINKITYLPKTNRYIVKSKFTMCGKNFIRYIIKTK